MRVCYFGTYRADYSRNQILIDGLRSAGVDVVECHEQLWRGIEDRVEAVSGGWRNPAFWWRVLRTYLRLLQRYFQVGSYDVLLVGYPGQFDVFLARLLSRIARRPLVWDIFMSIYLIALERGLDTTSSGGLRLIRTAERFACRLPDLLILDTEDYVAWFGATHGVPPGRFRLVPTGADNRLFVPGPCIDPPRGGDTRVLYYGTYIPNHGVTTIIEAARLLADTPNIHFEMIGRGPERKQCQELARGYGLSNITFIDWLTKPELVQHIRNVDICLGAFGTTPQSLMTVQNKIYEGLAMARPVVSGDSLAVRRVLRHGEEIYLCERANPRALAEAICTLANDTPLRHRLASNGHERYMRSFTVEQLGRTLEQHLVLAIETTSSSGRHRP